MNRLVYLFLFLAIIFIKYDIYSQTSTPKARIKSSDLIENEKKPEYAKELQEIVDSIDSIYTNAYENLKKGDKLIIFIHSAHGRLPSGEWQGGWETKRVSCTDMPEEHYSTAFSRKLFDLLKANPNIQIETHEEYLDVLNRKTNEYKYLNFTAGAQAANEKKAFIMLSQHLNNVAMNKKAGGTTNIPGIHILMDSNDNYYLGSISTVFSGFLTLYNKFDAGGFSREYATLLKTKLVQKGLKANGWEGGTVGDDRFVYFLNCPISIIFESGFISNIAEEKKMNDPTYQNIIVKEQYNALLESFKNFWGFDISGKKPVFIKAVPHDSIEMMKLSRIAIYYLKKTETQKAIKAIDEILAMESELRREVPETFERIKGELINAKSDNLDIPAPSEHRWLYIFTKNTI